MMLSIRQQVLLVACVASLLPARADAADITTKHDLRFNWGLGSAVGFFGVTYSYSPARFIELESGVGFGFSGLQLSAMPKFSVGTRHRFVLGAGASVGVDPVHGYLHTSLWINAEVGYSYRSSSGLSMLAAGGITVGATGRMHDLCIMGCNEAEKEEGSDIAGWIVPQLRFAIGYCF